MRPAPLPPQALTGGFDLAFTVAIGFALIGALVAAVALRPVSESTAVVALPAVTFPSREG